jgi:DNA-binding MarR family transcriptional regulator
VEAEPKLPFDPIERAGDLWQQHFGDASAMRLVTSVMRVQQLLIAQIDAVLKPFGISFARYEVLVLLTFSRTGALPLSKVGERLMVHPASVTNVIDRLEAQGLVSRVPDATDRRRTLATLTPRGSEVVTAATKALTDSNFTLTGIDDADADSAYAILRDIRAAAGDFPPGPEKA